MDDMQPTTRAASNRRWLGAAGLVAAGLVAGGVLAGTLSASAADSSTTGTTTAPYSSTATAPPAGHHDGPMGGPSPVRSDEKALSTTDAQKVKAAALAAVPGGTVYRVETDAGDGVYEAHMTKADGTPVTVKLDAAFKVTGVENGMGLGDPAPAGAPANNGTGSSTGGTGSA